MDPTHLYISRIADEARKRYAKEYLAHLRYNMAEPVKPENVSEERAEKIRRNIRELNTFIPATIEANQ